MNDAAERLALEYVDLCGKLAAVVEWCVEHPNECLADNPPALGLATIALRDARAKRSD